MISFDVKSYALKLLDSNDKLNNIGIRIRMFGERFRPYTESARVGANMMIALAPVCQIVN